MWYSTMHIDALGGVVVASQILLAWAVGLTFDRVGTDLEDTTRTHG